MPVSIRPFTAADAEPFLKVHHAAVRGTAATDYPASVIEAWAPTIRDAHIEHVRADQTGIKIVAEHDGEIVGIGEVAPHAGELRACYVSPLHGRKGIGRVIVTELEAIALRKGASSLWLDSSLTAEAFYQQLGYKVVERGEHRLANGVRMACIKMSRNL